MNGSSFEYAILMQWAAQSPALLVYFLGAVIALTSWQRYRVPAVLTLCAMVLLGALTLGMPVVFLSLTRWQSEFAWTMKQVGVFSTAIGLTSSVVHAVSIGLLLAAVFRWRSAPVASGPSNLPPPPQIL